MTTTHQDSQAAELPAILITAAGALERTVGILVDLVDQEDAPAQCVEAWRLVAVAAVATRRAADALAGKTALSGDQYDLCTLLLDVLDDERRDFYDVESSLLGAMRAVITAESAS